MRVMAAGVEMLQATALAALEAYALDPSPGNQADLSDYGINVLREGARKMGYDRQQLTALIAEEQSRVRGLTADKAGLATYLRMNRAGSEIPMSRQMRIGLFCQFAAKGLLRSGRSAAMQYSRAVQRVAQRVLLAMWVPPLPKELALAKKYAQKYRRAALRVSALKAKHRLESLQKYQALVETAWRNNPNQDYDADLPLLEMAQKGLAEDWAAVATVPFKDRQQVSVVTRALRVLQGRLGSADYAGLGEIVAAVEDLVHVAWGVWWKAAQAAYLARYYEWWVQAAETTGLAPDWDAAMEWVSANERTWGKAAAGFYDTNADRAWDAKIRGRAPAGNWALVQTGRLRDLVLSVHHTRQEAEQMLVLEGRGNLWIADVSPRGKYEVLNLGNSMSLRKRQPQMEQRLGKA